MSLHQKKCLPCEGGVPKLEAKLVQELLKQVPGWQVQDDKLTRQFQFQDFKAAMRFVNQMAEIAEHEGHHPDFWVSYNRVKVELWTHAIAGLSENDFILAAKIGRIL